MPPKVRRDSRRVQAVFVQNFGDRWLAQQRRLTGHRYGDNKYTAAASAFRKALAAYRKKGTCKQGCKQNAKTAIKNWVTARHRYLGIKNKGGNCRRVRRCTYRRCSDLVQVVVSAKSRNIFADARKLRNLARRARANPKGELLETRTRSPRLRNKKVSPHIFSYLPSI